MAYKWGGLLRWYHGTYPDVSLRRKIGAHVDARRPIQSSTTQAKTQGEAAEVADALNLIIGALKAELSEDIGCSDPQGMRIA